MWIIKWSALLYTNISLSDEPPSRCIVIKPCSYIFFVNFILFFFFPFGFLYFLPFSTLFVLSPFPPFPPFPLLAIYFVFFRLSYFLLPFNLSFFFSCRFVSVFYSTISLHVGKNPSSKINNSTNKDIPAYHIVEPRDW